MKKISFLFIICFLFFGFNSCNAQVKLILSGGVQVPTGDFKNVNDVGYGGSADVEFSLPLVGPTFFVSAGYDRWKISNTDYSNTFVPILGGVKYFFGTPGGLVTLYFGGALGIAIISNNIPDIGLFRNPGSESKFMWSPSVGVRLSNIDFNAKYQSFSSGGSTVSWFGLNLGIVLGR